MRYQYCHQTILLFDKKQHFSGELSLCDFLVSWVSICGEITFRAYFGGAGAPERKNTIYFILRDKHPQKLLAFNRNLLGIETGTQTSKLDS